MQAWVPKSGIEQEIKEAFDVIDLDGNKRLSLAELRRFFQSSGEKVSDEEIRQRQAEADRQYRLQ